MILTGDGQINQTDETLMIEKLESNTYEEKYDLNKDQKIDIIDLSYIVLNRKQNIEATPVKMLKLAQENVELKGTIVTAGNIASIFENNNNFVQLQPRNGQDISVENPVEMVLNLENNKETTEAIVISPPKEQINAIKQGKIEVTYVDSNGEEQPPLIVSIGSTSVASTNLEQSSIKLASLSQVRIASVQSRTAATATIRKRWQYFN